MILVCTNLLLVEFITTAGRKVVVDHALAQLVLDTTSDIFSEYLLTITSVKKLTE